MILFALCVPHPDVPIGCLSIPICNLQPQKSRKKSEWKKEACINLAIMKLACVVLRKKGGHEGACVCLCACLKVLMSASNASENVCHTVRGWIHLQGVLGKDEKNTYKISNFFGGEHKEEVKST